MSKVIANLVYTIKQEFEEIVNLQRKCYKKEVKEILRTVQISELTTGFDFIQHRGAVALYKICIALNNFYIVTNEIESRATFQPSSVIPALVASGAAIGG